MDRKATRRGQLYVASIVFRLNQFTDPAPCLADESCCGFG